MEIAENNCEMFDSWTHIKAMQLEESPTEEGANPM